MKFKFTLFILLCIISCQAFAQQPSKFLGTWSGKFYEYRGKDTVSYQFSFIFDKVEATKIYGTLDLKDVSDGTKNRSTPIYVDYSFGSGVEKLDMRWVTLYQNSKKYSFGKLTFTLVTNGIQSTLVPSFSPDETKRASSILWGNLALIKGSGDRKDVSDNTTNKPDGKTITPIPTPSVINSLKDDQKILSDGATLLFKGIKSSISIGDKNQIFNDTEFSIAPDKKQFLVSYSDHPFDFDMYALDLNADGIDEVLISYGDNYTSGNTGRNMMFFVKKGIEQSYIKQMDISTQSPDLMPVAGTYPNIIRVGPGTVYTSVWKWKDGKYQDLGMIKFTTIESFKTISLDDISLLQKSKGVIAVNSKLKMLASANSAKDKAAASKSTQLQKTIAKKGIGAKFIGKYWALGDYDHPFTVSKTGNNYFIKQLGSTGTGVPPTLVYNVKLDRLEGWLQDKGVKLKMLVNYEYDTNGITIKPENDRFGGPMYLKPYQ